MQSINRSSCIQCVNYFSSTDPSGALKRADFIHLLATGLATKPVQRAPLALERVDDVHRRHRLALGVLGVRDGVADDVLQEHLQHAARLLVDQTRDALHAAPPRQTTDGRLRDALDVVPQHLAMTLSASFPESLASLASSGHLPAAVAVVASNTTCQRDDQNTNDITKTNDSLQ